MLNGKSRCENGYEAFEARFSNAGTVRLDKKKSGDGIILSRKLHDNNNEKNSKGGKRRCRVERYAEWAKRK
uniref:Uncharacterized protein n=1 Tax=Ciona intestinalis TaxID=7719 RepID=H2XJU7_CIOIN